MRRDPLPWLLLLLLTLLASAAYLTRRPEHPLVDRLAELPWVGPAAERFRDAYRPVPAEAAEAGSRQEPLTGDRPAPRAGPVEVVRGQPPGSVWVRAGMVLRAAPDEDSPVVERVAQIGRRVLVERRGEWRRLSRAPLEGAPVEGWVRAEELTEPTAQELRAAAPVVPLPATPIEAEALARARELMGDGTRRLPCGSYELWTDATGPPVEACPRLAGQLDRLYAERTGLQPVGGARETILLFDDQGAYLIFRAGVSPASRRDAFASPGRGFVALAAGDKAEDRVRAALVHELVHLLNRRFLGPALPPWLDEGLAEELGMSRIAADGRLAPGTLGGFETVLGRARVVGGGRQQLSSVRSTMRRGELPTLSELAELDGGAFQDDERSPLLYALSAFWVRYLLGERSPTGGRGFRDFLAAVAAGERLEAERLPVRLEVGWRELEVGFRRWLDSEAAAGPAPGPGG